LEAPIQPDETLDSLLDKDLKIIQKRRGYRYSIDAILLAHFCRLRRGDKVIDLGTGNAIIPILLAARGEAAQIVGVEIQGDCLDMAYRSLALNKMQERIRLIQGDVRDLPGDLMKASFDVAISNPPYRPVQSGRVNPYPQKALARHEILGSLKDMAQAASFLLRPRGRFHVIYPASRTADMLLALRESGLEPKRIRIVYANAKEDARLIMAQAVKGGRTEMQVLKPLFVYDTDGCYTREMQKIYGLFQGSSEVTALRHENESN